MSRTFKITEEERTNLNRRMKMGFYLMKVEDLAKVSLKANVEINYTPDLIPRQSIVPILPLPETLYVPPTLGSIPSMKSQVSNISGTSGISLTTLPQNLNKYRPPILNQNMKARNTERLKAIVQKFKKHKKFPTLTNGISKAGKPQILYSLGRIEQEIKKHMHSIDTFKVGVLDLLDLIKETPTLVELVAEIRAFFQNLITQQKQIQFQTSIQEIQKNVDKITRELGDTKQQGQWYYKKKKRNDKFVDVKEMIYICDLIRTLPKAYLIGIWEIIHEQPFREIKDFKMEEIDISTLKIRKIREIEHYVKLVLTTLKRSKQKKKAKLEKRLSKEEEKLGELMKELDRVEEKKEVVEMVVENGEPKQQKEEGVKGDGEQGVKEENIQQNKQENKQIQPEQVNNQPDTNMIIQQPQPATPPRQRSEQDLRRIKQLQDKMEQIRTLLQVSSSDSSMITDDEEDFD